MSAERLAGAIRAVLTHPLVMHLKRVVRGASWRFKGRNFVNPDQPGCVNSVLFVCLGNICRSPFAAVLTDRLLKLAGEESVRCSSAGIRPSQAARCPEEACAVAREWGVSLESHIPQAVTHDLLKSHDVIFVMEAPQLAELRSAYPAFYERFFLLPLFDARSDGAFERWNIPDPFGQSSAVFRGCYERIDRALQAWLKTLPAGKAHR